MFSACLFHHVFKLFILPLYQAVCSIISSSCLFYHVFRLFVLCFQIVCSIMFSSCIFFKTWFKAVRTNLFLSSLFYQFIKLLFYHVFKLFYVLSCLFCHIVSQFIVSCFLLFVSFIFTLVHLAVQLDCMLLGQSAFKLFVC